MGCNIAIMKRFLPILFIISLFYFSCSEELQSGCTDCNAINYNADAVDDDGSCILLNTNRLSLYTVQDSVRGPFFDWFYDEYLIDIARDSCDSIGISINNYANITNSQGEINVNAQIIGDSIYIFYQIIEAKEQNLPSDYMNYLQSGPGVSSEKIAQQQLSEKQFWVCFFDFLYFSWISMNFFDFA